MKLKNAKVPVIGGVITLNPKLRYLTPEDHIHNSLYFEIKAMCNWCEQFCKQVISR